MSIHFLKAGLNRANTSFFMESLFSGFHSSHSSLVFKLKLHSFFLVNSTILFECQTVGGVCKSSLSLQFCLSLNELINATCLPRGVLDYEADKDFG